MRSSLFSLLVCMKVCLFGPAWYLWLFWVVLVSVVCGGVHVGVLVQGFFGQYQTVLVLFVCVFTLNPANSSDLEYTSLFKLTSAIVSFGWIWWCVFAFLSLCLCTVGTYLRLSELFCLLGCLSLCISVCLCLPVFYSANELFHTLNSFHLALKPKLELYFVIFSLNVCLFTRINWE